jgi:hypothetical protein
MSDTKMKPQSPAGVSSENANDMFSGAAAAKSSSDDRNTDEFGSSAEF